MSVFNYKRLSSVSDSLRAMARRFYGATALSLTPDEFIAAFISPEHVPTLRTVQEIVGFVGSTSATTVLLTSGGIALETYVSFGGTPPIILPLYMRAGIQPTCPDDVRAKIEGHADERYRMGCAFGDALDALTWLNDECGNAAAMAVMFPALTTVMASTSEDADNAEVKRARKLSQAKSFGSLPRTTPAQKQRLMEVSAIVNSMTLMADVPEKTVEGQHALLVVSHLKTQAPRTSVFTGAQTASFY